MIPRPFGILPLQLPPEISVAFALNLRLAFLFQLFGMQSLKTLSYVLLFHFPALPDRRQPCGDFVVVQRLRPGAQAVGQVNRTGFAGGSNS